MIEPLILKALRRPRAITDLLTTFKGNPAVFYMQAPTDKDAGWATLQYPRADYTVDWTYNPERKAAGAVEINVWCLNTGAMVPPEDIGEVIREELRDLFMTDDTGEVYALEWQRTDSFEAGGQNEPLTIGVTLRFDLLAFPVQATTDPDPVEGLNDWIKAAAPEAKVVGVDKLPELFRPMPDTPVIYARLGSDGSQMRNSYAVAWMDVQMPVHVFAPSTTARQLLCRQLCNALALDGECRLRDGSPMLIRSVAINASANPLRQGQLTVTGRYGVLRREQPGTLLQHAYYSQGKETT